MAPYPVDHSTLTAALRALKAHDNSYAEAAQELGQDRVFFWRFVHSGRAKPTNVSRLRAALIAKGYLHDLTISAPPEKDENSDQVKPLAKQVIQYLMDSVLVREAIEQEGSANARQ